MMTGLKALYGKLLLLPNSDQFYSCNIIVYAF